jgi:hypothetical protein
MLNHLKLRVELVEGLLLKYSVQCRVLDHQDGDTVKRQMELHFQEEWLPQKCKQRDYVLSAASTIQDTLFTIVNTVIVLCASMGVSRLTIQGKSTEVMKIACLLNTVYRKLPSQVPFT